MIGFESRFRELLEEIAEVEAERIAGNAMGIEEPTLYQIGHASGRYYALRTIVPQLCAEIEKQLQRS
jgi:hypothetical protein